VIWRYVIVTSLFLQGTKKVMVSQITVKSPGCRT
jgi:hypothetical protein